jgi:hypothetical protein
MGLIFFFQKQIHELCDRDPAEDIRYEITVPEGTTAKLVLPDGYTTTLGGGSYCFTTKK